MKNIIIAACYQFVPLADFETMKAPLLAKMHEAQIKGTIILAAEGINGSFAGLRQNMDDFYQFLRQDPRLATLQFKETFDDLLPFEKAKVKLRSEIVSMGIPEVDPKQTAGEYLDPDAWHALIQDPEVILIDTRNDYEYELGTFKNAINPATDHFREFPAFVAEHLSDKKDKKIAMFCTGGIRCEKSTSYLKAQGFQNVYQLHGGILHYLERKDSNNSLWEGSCFVFDSRVAVDKDLKRVEPQLPEDYKNRFSEKK